MHVKFLNGFFLRLEEGHVFIRDGLPLIPLHGQEPVEEEVGEEDEKKKPLT